MPSLDVFKADAFSMASLTAAINALPYQPTILGQLGIFQPVPITTTSAVVEKREGRLSVIQSGPRGVMTNVDSQPNRVVRSFVVPHIAINATIRADDVQNVRAFGSETETETVAGLVNDTLMRLRAYHETTLEWHRLCALRGIILDADGTTTLYNLFTEFGETMITEDFALDTTTTDVKQKCANVIRHVEDALGADTYSEIVGICGDNFFDTLVGHTLVKAAYANWNAAAMLQTQQLRTGFVFGGIRFINYRASIGGSAWLNTDHCRFFPIGVQGLFQHIMAPGDMIDTVNTRGQAFYAKQQVLPFDKGIEIHTQSNPLMMCTRPAALVLGTQ